ncbi:MAG: thiamine pyrophosphate-dependent dehydrogenase E1 component subunit alpha [Agromyces sp.]
MQTNAPMVQLLDTDGRLTSGPDADRYGHLIAALDDATLQRMWRDMTVARTFDRSAANLQRQGQLALWIPSQGQEAAQVGSAYATRPQDHIFPSYREHIVGIIRGLDPVKILALLRGVTLGGWNPEDTNHFHQYTLVLASQTLHSTGYAMGMQLDGTTGTGNPETDEALIVYYGDGSTSQGDASEALVFASSYQTPQVFFIQNNQWAISVPVERQSRVPLAQRGFGFGMPGTRIDGNDVLASYAVTREAMEAARSGKGPALIEALTYRLGAHTTADDPTKYRPEGELELWESRDPLIRTRKFLEGRGADEAFFTEADTYAADFAADVRKRALELEAPDRSVIFRHVYADPHPLMAAEEAWLAEYEASFGDGA